MASQPPRSLALVRVDEPADRAAVWEEPGPGRVRQAHLARSHRRLRSRASSPP
jgi:hypothetical protein